MGEHLDLFDRVVCAVGGRRGGLEAVRQVERLRGGRGRVVLVSVPELHLAVHAGMHATSARVGLREEARRAIEAALELAPGSDTRIVDGRAAGTLLWVLGDEHATLVACSDGRSRAAGIVLGGVATTLLHDAPCSVLVAREPADVDAFPRSIAVGLDGSPESLAAADVATRLGEGLGAPVRAITSSGGKPFDADGLKRSGLDLHTDPRPPVDALVAASDDADLLVVGSRGLHGLRSLGSVSERVAHQARCSVLVVRSPERPEPRKVLLVRDVMTSPVVTAGPDATVRELAQLMVEKGIGSVVVTDTAGAVVGIVTETDFEITDEPVPDTFLKWPRLLGRHVWSEESLEEVYADARNRTAESVMTSPVETVDADDELWKATETMMQADVKHLPVLEEGTVVGIVSRHDLLKGLLAEPHQAR
ncbi:MAG TPA: CBS domain-containing protein [Gaiellaceae bacterium]|nr:CBS domain-containing protein [Gaiellaceae bacterium]